MSRLGIGWALLKLGRRDEAHAAFAALAKTHPDHKLVQAGLRASTSTGGGWSVTVAPAGKLYQGHPLKRNSGGGAVSAQGISTSGWLGGVTARYNYFSTVPSPFFTSTSFDQKELWLHAGHATATRGVALHFTYVDDGDSYTGPFTIISASGWLQRFGTWSGQLSATRYDDKTAVRFAPAWRTVMPTGALGDIGLTPGLAVQNVDGDWYGSGSVNVDAGVAGWWLNAGFRVGDEERPTDLLVPVVFNVPDTVNGGLWLSASHALSPHWAIELRYAMTRYTSAGVKSDIYSNGHVVGLALTWLSRAQATAPSSSLSSNRGSR